MLTAKHKLEFKTGKRTAKTIVQAGNHADQQPPGRLPRITKMMALAIKFDQMIRGGVVSDQAELARLGHITRARMSQIMCLLALAPDIQTEILFLPMIECGRKQLRELDLRSIAAAVSWAEQRALWQLMETW